MNMANGIAQKEIPPPGEAPAPLARLNPARSANCNCAGRGDDRVSLQVTGSAPDRDGRVSRCLRSSIPSGVRVPVHDAPAAPAQMLNAIGLQCGREK